MSGQGARHDRDRLDRRRWQRPAPGRAACPSNFARSAASRCCAGRSKPWPAIQRIDSVARRHRSGPAKQWREPRSTACRSIEFITGGAASRGFGPRRPCSDRQRRRCWSTTPPAPFALQAVVDRLLDAARQSRWRCAGARGERHAGALGRTARRTDRSRWRRSRPDAAGVRACAPAPGLRTLDGRSADR